MSLFSKYTSIIKNFIAFKLAGLNSETINDRNVLFLSDVRDDLGGNLACIYNALDDLDWNLDFFCKDKHLHPFSKEDIYEIRRKLDSSKYILLEDVFSMLSFYKPRSDQEIIQLWHALGAYKKFGFSRKEQGLHVSNSHKKYTHAIVSSKQIASCYAQAFGIPVDRIIPTGIPRTDILMNSEWRSSVRKDFFEKHPDAKGKTIVLFAPTYRGTSIKDACYDMSLLSWNNLRDQLGDSYFFITKWHPSAYKNMLLSGALIQDNDFVIDMSNVRDVNDILPIADILITDYSSVIFDWLLMDKPIIYYVPDIDAYKNDRGLYFPFEDYVYGEVALNQNSLVDAIRSNNMMYDKRQTFRKKFMEACDGHSTENTIHEFFTKEPSQ